MLLKGLSLIKFTLDPVADAAFEGCIVPVRLRGEPIRVLVYGVLRRRPGSIVRVAKVEL